MESTRIALLQQMPIFGGIRADVLDFLLNISRKLVVRSGEFFFCEGELGDAMYVLETGKVVVFKTAREQTQALRYLSPGDCFGEMALIDMTARSAAVRAVADCTAIEITAASLSRVYERDPEQFLMIQMNMGREVSRRLREADERLLRGG